jgi:hypothetical protein
MLGLRNVFGSIGTFAAKPSGGNLYFDRPFIASGVRGDGSLRRVPHTLKLSPHEQLALALGLENLNPPATIALE